MDRRKQILLMGTVLRSSDLKSKLQEVNDSLYDACEAIIKLVNNGDKKHTPVYHLVKDESRVLLYRGIKLIGTVDINNTGGVGTDTYNAVHRLVLILNDLSDFIGISWQSFVIPFKRRNSSLYTNPMLYLDGCYDTSLDLAMRYCNVCLRTKMCSNLPLALISDKYSNNDDIKCLIKRHIFNGDDLSNFLTPENGFNILNMWVHEENNACIVYKCELPMEFVALLIIEY